MKKNVLVLAILTLILTSCAVVKPGEVALRQRLGKLKGQPKTSGLMLINPFITKVIKVPIRTVNREVKLSLPSKEGLNVAAEISILYHVETSKVKELLQNVGLGYERTLILSTFRSAAANICAKYYAKDMHSGNRAEIEEDVKTHMTSLLNDRGLVIESILLKSIALPDGLYKAIEAKLQAEQQAQQMKFVLDREIQEAERKRIEAEGIQKAQIILKEGITPDNIKWRSLDVFEKLSNSPNTKVIITNGTSSPLLMYEMNVE